jgi:hypothetical protein
MRSVFFDEIRYSNANEEKLKLTVYIHRTLNLD